MSEKSEVRCATPKCVEAIEKYGAHYHGVYVRSDHLLCQRCGGTSADGGESWRHVCKKCGVSVEPGELRGYFVPHRCRECDDKLVAEQKASGRMCRRCNTVIAYCCC